MILLGASGESCAEPSSYFNHVDGFCSYFGLNFPILLFSNPLVTHIWCLTVRYILLFVVPNREYSSALWSSPVLRSEEQSFMSAISNIGGRLRSSFVIQRTFFTSFSISIPWLREGTKIYSSSRKELFDCSCHKHSKSS